MFPGRRRVHSRRHSPRGSQHPHTFEGAADRIESRRYHAPGVGALLLVQNDEWQLRRRYLQLEGLQTLTDNQPARLSAVVS